MPDISLLVEMASYFEIGILELIEGERKLDAMMEEKGDEINKIANYTGEREKIFLKNIRRTDVIAMVGCLLSVIAMEAYNAWGDKIWLLLQVMFLSLVGAMLFYNMTYACGINNMLGRYKKKHRFIKRIELLVIVLLLISVCRNIYAFLTGTF